jgi:hypothetical protein
MVEIDQVIVDGDDAIHVLDAQPQQFVEPVCELQKFGVVAFENGLAVPVER